MREEISLGLLQAYLDDELPAQDLQRVVPAIVASRTTQQRLKQLQLANQLVAIPLAEDIPTIDVADAVMALIEKEPRRARTTERLVHRLRTSLADMLRWAALSYPSGSAVDAVVTESHLARCFGAGAT